tara:strand:- start:72 stop:266 length:195 start_codon:yes stop_codon:yes gene_type:complete
MSRKTVFWIAFFALTLVEIGQLAYSHEKHITEANDSSQIECQQVNSEVSGLTNSVYGQPPIMLI